ncbi:TPA: LPXTG cell wall anchor domain-containing protein [Enterococcus faecalis]|nr:LPXTG cell wall anchor domain-containing protein [Enterococcus faecalis]
MKKFRIFFAMTFLAVSFLFINSPSVEAASYTNNDGVINVTLQNGPKFTPANSMKFKFDFDLSGVSIKSGDTFEIDYPESIEYWGDPNFNFYDEEGNLYGTGVNKDGKIIITFIDTVENKTDIKGYLNAQFKPTPNKMSLGKNTLTFDSKNGIIPIEVELVDSIKNISKKGTVQKMPNGENGIRWTIIINRNSLFMNNIQLEDIITDPALKYVPGTLKVSEGIWIDDVKTSYKRVRTMTPDVEYTVSEVENGMTLLIPSSETMYVVDMFTSVSNPQLLNTKGSTFSNNATLKWGDENGESQLESVQSLLTIKNNDTGIGGSTTPTTNSSDSTTETSSNSESQTEETKNNVSSSDTISGQPEVTDNSVIETSESMSNSTLDSNEHNASSTSSDSTLEKESNISIESTDSLTGDSTTLTTTDNKNIETNDTEISDSSATITSDFSNPFESNREQNSQMNRKLTKTAKDSKQNAKSKKAFKEHLPQTGQVENKMFIIVGIVASMLSFIILTKYNK